MKTWIVGMMLVLMAVNSAGCAQAQGSPLVGRKAPDFTLEKLKGGSASLGEVIQGKKAIVFFFSTWCPHCREQLRSISRQKAALADKGIELVLVDIGESKIKVDRFMKMLGIDHDVFMDAASFVAQTYEVMGVPLLFFIGEDGKIRYVEFGLPDNYEEIFD